MNIVQYIIILLPVNNFIKVMSIKFRTLPYNNNMNIIIVKITVGFMDNKPINLYSSLNFEIIFIMLIFILYLNNIIFLEIYL